jgi:hypothetical protein
MAVEWFERVVSLLERGAVDRVGRRRRTGRESGDQPENGPPGERLRPATPADCANQALYLTNMNPPDVALKSGGLMAMVSLSR